MKLKNLVKRIFSPKRGWHAPDLTLVAVTGVIVVFGLIALSSSSVIYAYHNFDGDTYHFLKKQLFGLVLGAVAFYFLSKIDYHYWRRYAFWFLIFSVFLLLLVFVPGLSANWGEARSWINVFGFSLQPSEFVKLSFLLYLSAWLEVRRRDLGDIHQGIGPFVVLLSLIAFLMILQPDIGTLLIVTATSLVVYFVGGGKIRHILAIVLIGLVGFFGMVQLKDYQAARLKCMLDPSYDTQKVCYQVNQSLIAVGSGGIFGRGLGESRQKFLYLPEVSGDSIFAIIAEEIGFVFSTVLVFLYLLLFYRGFKIASRAPDDFGQNLAIGIVSWIVIQTIINIGGVINLMPMTGVPLPLISYGGSAVLSAMAAMGILVNVSRQTK